jgi:hypothetical protein
MATEDEEQATQEVADYLRRQDWGGPHLRDEPHINLWWIQRAEDVLDAVAEAGAKLFNGSLELDDDETGVLRARIEAAVGDALGNIDSNWMKEETKRDVLVDQVLFAVKGFINGQVV